MLSTDVVTTADLQSAVVAMVRAFGLHRPDETPCGQALAVSEAHALSDLLATDGLSQVELATRLRLEKSTVSRLVAQLERKGWVERRRDDGDGRVQRLSLTPAGSRVAETVAVARRERFEQVLLRLPDGARSDVIAAIDLLAKAMAA